MAVRNSRLQSELSGVHLLHSGRSKIADVVDYKGGRFRAFHGVGILGQ
jgi:hypothetical protein